MNKIIIPDCGAFPGNKLRGKEKYKNIYHYTSFDTFIKIWLGKQLKFGDVTYMNDIQEVSFGSQTSMISHLPLLSGFNDIRKSYKQLSFTMDYDSYIKGFMSPIMWAHYGDKRKGVCIEFDFKKIAFPKSCFHGPIHYKKVLSKYVQIPDDIRTSLDLEEFIKANKKSIFFTKQNCWKEENEYRVIANDLEFLDISNAITAVYLTSYNSKECELVEKLVNDQIPVSFILYEDHVGFNIPRYYDSKSYRELYGSKRKDPLAEQAEAHYQKYKNDDKSSLIKDKYIFDKSDNK